MMKSFDRNSCNPNLLMSSSSIEIETSLRANLNKIPIKYDFPAPVL